MSVAVAAPEVDWVDRAELDRDPYPVYARLQREAPIAWAPSLSSYLLTSYESCRDVNLDQELFTGTREYTARHHMGVSMLHKDDPEHAEERAMYGGVLKPRAIRETWTRIFSENAAHYIDELRKVGPGADIVEHFSAPLSSANLRAMLGFDNARPEDLHRWSQSIMDGNINVTDDDEIWARYVRAGEEIDAAIDEMLPRFRAEPNGTLLSTLQEAGMSLEQIRANIKMTIGGAVKEPRDVVVAALHGLFGHPEQYEQVKSEDGAGRKAFDEAVRWISPIGMYPRKATRETDFCGVRLPAGARLSVVIAAANRDPSVFERPDEFDINRPRQPHLAFANGAHICAGQHVAKAMVGDIALPALLRELDGLRPALDTEPEAGGWIFRRIHSLPVTWGR